MTYAIRLSPAARQLGALDRQARRRIQAVTELLADNPRPAGANKLVGGHGESRVRTGAYRVIYAINDGDMLILMIAIGHPRDIYDRR